MTYNKLNNVVGWLVWLTATIVYLLTVAPTASFWDCGEFIAVSNEMEVSHPPGAPFYLLVGRVLAMFAASPQDVAYMVNLLSVFSSSFSVLFIFWTITIFGKKILLSQRHDQAPAPDSALSGSQTFLLLSAGVVGALSCTFTSSFWFNAVESEVYAFASFFTTLNFWLMLKWEARADDRTSFRYPLLILFLSGLSIGVQLLSLLTIPALVLIYYFRKYPVNLKGLAVAGGVAVVLLGVINSFVIKTTFDLAWMFERTMVGAKKIEINEANGQILPAGDPVGWGMPTGTGAATFFILLVVLLVGGLWYTHRRKLVVPHLALLAVSFVYLGLSTYGIIFIRANAGTPINENDPSNILYFVKYMKREQYGEWPILRGVMYNARPKSQEPGDKDKYIKLHESNTYAIAGKEIEVEYRDEDKRFFPRMWSPGHYTRGQHGYKNYISERNLGRDPDNPYDDTPSGSENLAFFWDYQVKHMYLRYFLQNFAGRQSDEQDKDWEAGLLALFKDPPPESVLADKSRNHYYALPLLLGLIGLFFHFYKRRWDATVVLTLFFFTGMAIILYLNQPPDQPRERDYAFAGSFHTFTIWIGLGVLAVAELGRQYLKEKANYLAGPLCFLLVPVIMGYENWDDHSRAGRYIAPDSAYNLLMSCEKNAILFTNGDNDTFPLWYLQEVEDIRTDVRIINLSLLNTDWYIHHLKAPINQAPKVPLSVPEAYYVAENNAVAPLRQRRKVLPVDKVKLVENGVVKPEDTSRVSSPMVWDIEPTYGNSYVRKQDLMIMNILDNVAYNGWDRPVYFAITIPPKSYLNLTSYFRMEGLAYRVVPIKYGSSNRQQYGEMDIDKMYNNLVNEFRYRGLDDGDQFLNYYIRRMMGNTRGNFIRLGMAVIEQREQLSRQIDQMEALKNASDGMSDETLAANAAKADSLRKRRQELKRMGLEGLDFVQQRVSDELVYTNPNTLAQMGRLYYELGSTKPGDSLLALAEARAYENLQYAKNEERQTITMPNYDLSALIQLFQMYNGNLPNASNSDKAVAVGRKILELSDDQKINNYLQSTVQQLRPQQPQTTPQGQQQRQPQGQLPQGRQQRQPQGQLPQGQQQRQPQGRLPQGQQQRQPQGQPQGQQQGQPQAQPQGQQQGQPQGQPQRIRMEDLPENVRKQLMQQQKQQQQQQQGGGQ